MSAYLNFIRDYSAVFERQEATRICDWSFFYDFCSSVLSIVMLTSLKGDVGKCS